MVAARLAARVDQNPPEDHLPQTPTRFFGRQRAVAELAGLLRATRVLTLLGPGGVGKSRLASEIARRVRLRYPGGVALVQLAPVSDPRVVPYVVARAVGLPDPPVSDLVETLARALRDRKALLVFDNCEHLVDACAELAAELLQRTRSLQVLATSRHVLGVMGEMTWMVPPLTVPDSSVAADAQSIQRFEAVQLFMDRARAARPDFCLNEDNAAAIADICRRLDGLPLAIELAAARVRAFNSRQIADRLDQELHLLVGGPRTAAARHRTMRATLDWSDQLLSDAERRLLARASVFTDTWTIEALEAICANVDVPRCDASDLLSHLVVTRQVIHPGMFKEFTREAGMGLENGADANLSVGG
ncbi:MAG: AAA family ATPase [Chloroflexi bacterium]|nr:AAA family ATPase [Chloroflexota bacterium]